MLLVAIQFLHNIRDFPR